MSRDEIVGYIRTNGPVRPHDLVRRLSFSRMALHRQLRWLVEQGVLTKTGKPPLVFYSLATKPSSAVAEQISEPIRKIIDDTYLYVTPVGELLEGWLGFVRWNKDAHQSKRLAALASEYVKTRNDADQFLRSERIEATERFKQTYGDDCFLDKVWYKDFYSLPTFGKTKMGQLVLYAKQSQSRELIKRVADQCGSALKKIVAEFDVQVLGWIPPTVAREIQFMKELAHYLGLSLPTLNLNKSYLGQIHVPQKTLGRLEERVTNARETIFIKNSNQKFDNILLIDDAVGSGATLNETAKKIKQMGIAKKVYGFAVVGSMKGFEVIREV